MDFLLGIMGATIAEGLELVWSAGRWGPLAALVLAAGVIGLALYLG